MDQRYPDELEDLRVMKARAERRLAFVQHQLDAVHLRADPIPREGPFFASTPVSDETVKAWGNELTTLLEILAPVSESRGLGRLIRGCGAP